MDDGATKTDSYKTSKLLLRKTTTQTSLDFEDLDYDGVDTDYEEPDHVKCQDVCKALQDDCSKVEVKQPDLKVENVDGEGCSSFVWWCCLLFWVENILVLLAGGCALFSKRK